MTLLSAERNTRATGVARPLVTVMVPAYNAAPFIEQTILSVLGQSITNLEVVILDDGSSDGTCQVVERLAARDSRIRLRCRPNAGIVPTRNELLEMARGEFVAVLDADDIAAPRRLEHQIDYLRSHPDCIGVGGDVEIIDPDGDALCVWRLPKAHDVIDAKLLNSPDMVICHSALTMRREDLIRLGGYRPQFNNGTEDRDLLLRLAEAGKLVNLPEVVVKYRVHPSSISHRRVEAQRRESLTAIRDARSRRGLFGAEVVSDRAAASVSEQPQPYELRWGWWALTAKNLPAARKHARRAVMHSPLSSTSWRLLACAVRGH